MFEARRDHELRLFEPLLVADRRGIRIIANRRLDLLVGELIDPLPVGPPFWQALKVASDPSSTPRFE
jgi:hypothetical protein